MFLFLSFIDISQTQPVHIVIKMDPSDISGNCTFNGTIIETNCTFNGTFNGTSNGTADGDVTSFGSGIGLSHFDSMSLLGRLDYFIMLIILIFAVFSNSISIKTFAVRKRWVVDKTGFRNLWTLLTIPDVLVLLLVLALAQWLTLGFIMPKKQSPWKSLN